MKHFTASDVMVVLVKYDDNELSVTTSVSVLA